MIGADVDQIHDIKVLHISRFEGRKYSQEIFFPSNTSFLPKELYNIISINKITLCKTDQILMISSRIINLYNITEIFLYLHLIILPKEILKLPKRVLFVYMNEYYYPKYLYSDSKKYKEFIMNKTICG